MNNLQEQYGRLCLSHLSLARDLGSNGSIHRVPNNGVLRRPRYPGTRRTGRQALCPLASRDEQHKKKLVHTCWLCVAFFFLGWSVSMTGPSFPDLRIITGADLESASWIFTSGAFGYLLGSFVGGVAFDKFNRQLVMCISLIGMALTNVAVPWCTQLWVMTLFMVLCGGFEGSIETGGNADIVAVWGVEGQAAMLAIHFAYSAGGIVAPFVIQPFLAEEKQICDPGVNTTYENPRQNTNNMNETNHTNENSITYDTYSKIAMDDIMNNSLVGDDGVTIGKVMNASFGEVSSTLQCVVTHENTNVHHAYIITTVLTLIAAVPFFLFYISSRKHEKSDATLQDNSSNPTRLNKLPAKLKLIALILLSGTMFIVTSIEDNFNAMLMTFCISYLEWPKSYGTLANSLSWASFSVGRLIGIFIAKLVRTCRLINICLCVLTISFTGCLAVSLTNYSVLIWAFIPLVGISLSLIIPSLFIWTEERILSVTGKISSLFLVTGSLGAMVTPLLFGYVMEENSPLWFVYLLLGFSILGVLWYCLAQCTEWIFIRPLLKTEQNKDKLLTSIDVR